MADDIISYPVLPPIPTTGLTPADVEDLARITREKMLDELIRLTERARSEVISPDRKASLGSKGKRLDDHQKTVVVNGGHALSEL